MIEPRKFAPSEPVALEPRAFGMFLFEPYMPTTVDRGGVTVLSVRGPVQQFRDPFCESYEFIVARVREALAGSPRALVLSISSPGGLVSGVFETADSIRAACAAAGVPLYAYVDGAACSAAYALACAAQHISAPTTGSVGSIGVIAECIDASAQLAQMGVAVRMVTSGASKGDGDPRMRAEGPALTRIQAKVTELAEVFFAYVAQHRPMSADEVRALDAGVFLGAKARELGLVDEVQTLEDLLSAISANPAQTKGTMSMSKGYEDSIAGLRKAAAGDDEKEAKKAKRMLAAELAEDDEPPKKDGDDEEAKAKAEGDPPPPKKDDEEAKAAAKAAGAVSASTAGELATRLSTVEQRLEAQERSEILASRPDLSKSLLKLLATKPVDEVRSIVDAIEKPKKPNPAAAANVVGTRGEGQGGDVSGPSSSSPHAADMDRMMGFQAQGPAVRREGTAMVFSAAGSPAGKGGAK